MSDDILDALRTSPLLSSLTERQARQLASIATIRTFADGETIIEQGTTGALALWVIVEGQVAVSVDGEQVATYGPGAHLGEMAVLADSEKPRTAGVAASGPVRALRIAKWDLLSLIKGNPDVAMAMIAELAGRLERAEHRNR